MQTEEIPTCSRVVRNRRKAEETKNGYIHVLGRLVVLIVCGLVIFTKLFLVMQAPDNGMFPAIKGGDLLIGFRLQREFLKNDVVVCEVDGEKQVGRILAKESDIVSIDDTGTLLVNGTAQSGEILFPTYPKDGMEYPYTVPKGCVFILGDYRTQAEDSRDFGCVKMEDVKANVITILRRRAL